jgi:hypothetical protein
MRRREFVTLLGVIAVAYPIRARADPPSRNRSLPVLEPVCECRKRKLKKATRDGRRKLTDLVQGSSPFVRQETWVTGPNLRKCRGFAQRRFWLAGHIGFEPVSVDWWGDSNLYMAGSKFAALSSGITTRKDWISCAQRASLLAVVERQRRSRDRAPPAFAPGRGFGGDGARCRR